MEPPIWVLLHGTPLSPSVWDGVATVLAETAEVRRPRLEPTSDGEVVEELARTVLADLPRTAELHLVGHSFGGQVALEVALLAQETDVRITGLTMVCSRDTPYPAFAAVADSLRRGEPVDVDATLARWFRADELARGGPVVDLARRCVRQADPTTWARCLDAIATFDRSQVVASLALPVHLVAAELDHVSTVEAMTDFAGRLAQGQLTVLPGAAHMSAFLDPDALAELLRAGV